MSSYFVILIEGIYFLKQIFQEESMAIGYVIYILLIFIGCTWAGWKWLVPYLKTENDLHIITNKLAELEEGKKNTHERIQEFNHWIQENAQSKFMKEFVLPSWRDYYEKYKQFNQKGLPFTPDIFDFFLEDNLMQRFGKRKLVEAVPGILLSLGIIGTFFGIALGVSDLKTNGNTEAMQSGISTLLSGMKVKFASSIAGILLSIIWQIIDKMKFYPTLILSFRHLRQRLDLTFPTQEQSTVLSQMLVNQEKQMEDFQLYVTETMIPTMVSGMSQAISQNLTPHLEETQSMVKTMVDNSQVIQQEQNAVLSQMLVNQEKQTEDFQSYVGETMIPSMVSGISQALNQNLTPHLEETQSMMKMMVENSQVNQLEGINSMVDHFVQSLSEITGDHMKELGQALHMTIEWQQRVHEEMSVLVESMQDSAKEQSLMVEKTTALTGQINNYTEKITDYHSVMENTIERLNETTERNGQLQAGISELLEKMTAERQLFHEHFDIHLNQLKSRVSEFSEQTEQQIDLNNKLAINLEHYHSLSQSQQELSESLVNQAALSKEANKETSNLVQKMNEVSDKQATIQQELNAVFAAVVNEKSNVGNMLTEINGSLISQLSDMDKRIEHLRQVWETTSNVFTSVNKQLSVSMNQFTDDMHRGLEHTFEQFDDELAKSVNYLSKAVTAIHDGVSDLPDSLETLKTSVTELNKQAKLMTKNV